MSFLMRKKSSAGLQGLQDDPFLITTSSVVPKGSFSAPTFDRFLVGEDGRDAFTERNGRAAGEGGLGKKLRSFPWGGKKQLTPIDASLAPPPSPGLAVPGSPSSVYSSSSLNSPDSPGGSSIRNSTLAAFPVPPSTSTPSPSAPKQHATAFIAPHVGVSTSDSVSTVSTFKSSSSFASSNLFHNTDEWESGSEATSMSITSSPESSSKDSTGETKAQRMWRVKGLADSPLKHRGQQEGGLRVVEEEDETESRRNSTPIPRMVAAMLADPETPPRAKRYSASESKPSPTSPPLDLGYERMLRALRGQVTPSPPASPEGSRDADDEDDSPTQGAAAARLFPSNDSLSGALGPKTRIPSIRFEGISMDAVFAQVEKNMKGSPKASKEQKATRRRTRVLSMYRPMSFGGEVESTEKEKAIAEEEEEPIVFDSNTLSPSASDLDALRCTSTTPTPERPMDVARPRPYPRRTSSRPAPLDVEAANAFPTLEALAAASPAESFASFASPPLSGAFAVPHHAAPRDLFSPTSPTFSLAPSPTFATSPKSPSPPPASSPRLAEPFVPSPTPSSTSTFRSSSVIPEVCIFPPSLDDVHGEWEAPINQAAQPGPTKVVVLPPKRLVRASTRAAPKKAGERRTYIPPPPQDKENYTPPHSPALSTTSTIHTPVQPYSVIDARRLSSNSPLSVRQSDAEDSSDCEETLHNMLMRLNRPHTPPAGSAGASLTASALEQHTTQQASVSLLERRLRVPSYDGPSITVTDTDLEFEEMERERERFEQEQDAEGWTSASTSNDGGRRGKKAYESDDSRFSDAPLSIMIPKLRLTAPHNPADVPLPLSPVVTSCPTMATINESPIITITPEEPSVEDLDPIEQEINATLASIEQSPSLNSFASSSSSSSFASARAASDRSSLAYAKTPPESPRIPRSRTTSSDLASILSEATTDSELEGDGDSVYTAELGVVMMGQRVSCAYDVGYIGVAM
ncbi:hypothetical protein BCR35DRAFT_305390 [Leucosporidium creatinivorum]|uniref:Uncharacterized protein n=1 Tax=Leucosporidium creatinivorum TaxID=106004 RepID=A0A1Y2F2A7_9BASI|nr:hypothetical protein BCR35DRAFT_305390 [Leucosporidium creatinivorum]